MKNRTFTFLLAVMVTVLSVWTSKAQTNKAAGLVLPPKDWDFNKNILYSLTVTNRQGDYVLSPAWVGVDKVTVRTGYHTNRSELAEEPDRSFRFDRFTVGREFPVAPEDRYIRNSDRQVGGGFTYRRHLPTDKELLEIRDVSAVTNLFGYDPFIEIKDGAGQEVFMGHFTLAPYDSIETVWASFYVKRGSSKVDSILVRRGHFHQ